MENNKSDLLNAVFDKVISLALKSPEFKKKLLANPKSALEETLGVEAPKDLEIKVLEDSNGQLKLEMQSLKRGQEELSNADLSAIVGGVGWWSCF